MIWRRTIMCLLFGMICLGMTACGGMSACGDNAVVQQASSPKEVRVPDPGLKESPHTDTSLETAGAKPGAGKPTMGNATTANSVGASGSSARQGITPGMIVADPDRYESRTVMVRGVFHGWRGPCTSAPPVTRGDWMLADPTGCLYVHGPVPAGMDPARPAGEAITVTGVVRLKNGFPYLEAGR